MAQDEFKNLGFADEEKRLDPQPNDNGSAVHTVGNEEKPRT